LIGQNCISKVKVHLGINVSYRSRWPCTSFFKSPMDRSIKESLGLDVKFNSAFYPMVFSDFGTFKFDSFKFDDNPRKCHKFIYYSDIKNRFSGPQNGSRNGSLKRERKGDDLEFESLQAGNPRTTSLGVSQYVSVSMSIFFNSLHSLRISTFEI
jgi:hypothetical protein